MAQVPFSEYDEVVKALPAGSSRSDAPRSHESGRFNIRLIPGRGRKIGDETDDLTCERLISAAVYVGHVVDHDADRLNFARLSQQRVIERGRAHEAVVAANRREQLPRCAGKILQLGQREDV